MDVKQKAKELVDKYSVYTSGWNYDELAKQCALIAVDEILKETLDIYFWHEVKQEIEKL
jgi:hypothetical protein